MTFIIDQFTKEILSISNHDTLEEGSHRQLRSFDNTGTTAAVQVSKYDNYDI